MLQSALRAPECLHDVSTLRSATQRRTPSVRARYPCATPHIARNVIAPSPQPKSIFNFAWFNRWRFGGGVETRDVAGEAFELDDALDLARFAAATMFFWFWGVC